MRIRRLPTLVALLLLLAAFAPADGDASAAPVLSVHGLQLRWTAPEGSTSFRLMTETASGRQLSTVTGRILTPPAQPGEAVTFRVKSTTTSSPWSNAVTITYPAGEEPVEEPPAEEAMSVGINAGGWGPSAFSDIAGAVKSVRLESRFATDAEVGAAASAGVSIGAWLFGTGGTIGAINPAEYAGEVLALFRRYGKGGSFWKGRADLGSRAVEILNEPGNPYFWSDPGNYRAYAALITEVHRVLEALPAAERPRLLVSYDGGYAGDSYGRALLSAYPALSKIVGGWTVHPYGGHGANSALGDRARVSEAYADTHAPVYITEIGWPTASGQADTGDSRQWSEAQQATNIVNFVRWARSTGYVAMVDIFNYVDYGTNNWYGIERKDRSHKPSFAALAGA